VLNKSCLFRSLPAIRRTKASSFKGRKGLTMLNTNELQRQAASGSSKEKKTQVDVVTPA
jgi:hypothetical protein